MKRIFTLICIVLTLCGFTVSSYAALKDNLDGTVTQTRNDGSILMWLKDGNTAATETFGVSGILSDGTMDWATANDWIAAMNASNYLGYNDWRLPVTLPVDGSIYDYTFSYDGSTDIAYNISAPGSAYPGSTGSEMAYMFYTELGNTGHYDIAGNTTVCFTPPYCTVNSEYFVNLDVEPAHWSGTTYGDDPNDAWFFSFGSSNGYQGRHNKAASLDHVWAVRVVPEPVSSILFVAGGTLLGGRLYLRKRKK